jgi:hypothetical protein
MANPFDHFGGFLLAVWGHAFTLLAGCAVTVVIGWIERHILKKQMPLWADLSILLCFLFFACFQAWQDEYRRAESLKHPPLPPTVTVNIPPSPPAQVVIQPSTTVPTVAPFISSFIKELPAAFISHGLPTTEVYVAAHGTISDPTFVLECNAACEYETAMSLSTSTLPESKQLSPMRIWVHFAIPAQLSDGQQVSIRVRSDNQESIHTVKVRRVAK